MNTSLIRKYNIAGPRYTSYPTVPYWHEKDFNIKQWENSVVKSFNESNHKEGVSIYIHLPFCESLCTFCACHKRITKRHSVEKPYIDALLKEWTLYCSLFPSKPNIKEIHLGGGTPTFFQPQNLEQLIRGILSSSDVNRNASFSFEAHPNTTTKEHLQELYHLGFRRASFGVQDYDVKVQQTINRVQPFEQVKKVTSWAKEIGYASISHDLVFGLPHQTTKSIANTISLTKKLKPDRIAFYSYAHVPWVKNVGQRGFCEKDLPNADKKRMLYEVGKQSLSDLGYIEIGMDHFALTSDDLYKAVKEKTLHRNFMGYTPNRTQLMIGLGMSAISDSWYGFAQNNKSLEDYMIYVNKDLLPVFRGHKLTEKDLIIRKHILNIMCHFETSWEKDEMKFLELEKCLERLKEMEDDNLVVIKNNKLMVLKHAHPYIRNICMAFDLHLISDKPKTKIFSMTI